MKVLFCILTWISLMSGMGAGCPVVASPKKELEDQVAAHLQAAAILNVNAIHATIRLLDLLVAEYDNGATNVDPEFWEREVITRCDSVATFLDDAVQYIESVLPEKIRDPFWTDIYYCQDSMAGMSRRWKSLGSIYCSEFQTIMTGAQNYLHSYLIIFGARLREMDDVVERYSRLLNEGPEARKRRAKEEAAQEKIKERKEKALKRRVKMAGFMKSLRTAPKSMYPGDGKVQFMGIPLGTGYARCVKELKAADFSLKLSRDENHSFYGMCHEGFLTGSIDGIPVSMRLTASSFTRSIYEIEITFRGFIDQDEAIEECDRILARERGLYPYTAVDVDQVLRQIIQDADASPTPKMFDMLSNGGKQVVWEMCFMKSELLLHLFDDQPREDRLNSFGNISFGVYEMSHGQEHIVRVRYFDRSVGDAAGKEAKQGR